MQWKCNPSNRSIPTIENELIWTFILSNLKFSNRKGTYDIFRMIRDIFVETSIWHGTSIHCSPCQNVLTLTNYIFVEFENIIWIWIVQHSNVEQKRQFISIACYSCLEFETCKLSGKNKQPFFLCPDDRRHEIIRSDIISQQTLLQNECYRNAYRLFLAYAIRRSTKKHIGE